MPITCSATLINAGITATAVLTLLFGQNLRPEKMRQTGASHLKIIFVPLQLLKEMQNETDSISGCKKRGACP